MANIAVQKDNGNKPATMPVEQRWEPLRLIRDLMGWDPFREMSPQGSPLSAGFVAPFEVKETNDGYLFKADVPGVKEPDLEVTVTGNRLSVSGKREEERKEQSGDLLHVRTVLRRLHAVVHAARRSRHGYVECRLEGWRTHAVHQEDAGGAAQEDSGSISREAILSTAWKARQVVESSRTLGSIFLVRYMRRRGQSSVSASGSVIPWVSESRLPSGSLNQATFAPSGVVQIPRGVLLQEIVALEHHAARHERGDLFADIGDVPAEGRVRRRR